MTQTVKIESKEIEFKFYNSLVKCPRNLWLKEFLNKNACKYPTVKNLINLCTKLRCVEM